MVNPAAIQKLPSVFQPVTDEKGANAAVALLLKPQGEDSEILLVKRAVHPKDVWSGQMAFPGGKREPHDTHLKATVTRETFEETGINIAGSRFLGVLGAVPPMIKSGFLVLPFVVALETEPEINLNHSELDSHIWVPYEKIVQSNGKTRLPNFGEVPAFVLENVVVWGMTYKILSDFILSVETLKTQ
jgi:8-oxo-dGTP pyrophosphatase MutT (NUDIX family)